MKDEVLVALAQIPVDSLDWDRNLTRVLQTMRAAGEQGADLVVFPELVNLGQVPEPSGDFPARYVAAAEPIPGRFTREIGAVAAASSLHVAFGMAERHPDVPYTVFDSAVLVEPSGAVVGVQRKLHLAGAERHYFGRGDRVETFQTDLGVLSLQICYDVYFPEVCRAAALNGAEILLGLFNVTDREDWPDRLASLASVRAYENMQHVVLVNRVGEHGGRVFGGESVVASPPGRVVLRGPRLEEALLLIRLDSETLARERARRPVFADRRPEVYGGPPEGR